MIDFSTILLNLEISRILILSELKPVDEKSNTLPKLLLNLLVNENLKPALTKTIL